MDCPAASCVRYLGGHRHRGLCEFWRSPFALKRVFTTSSNRVRQTDKAVRPEWAAGLSPGFRMCLAPCSANRSRPRFLSLNVVGNPSVPASTEVENENEGDSGGTCTALNANHGTTITSTPAAAIALAMSSGSSRSTTRM